MLSNYQEFEDILRSSSADNTLTSFKPRIRTILHGDFYMRFTAIQSWYIRCSFANKLKFINKLFEIIKLRDSSPDWYDVIKENRIDKLSAYAATLKHHQFHYDKIIFDTNRTLDSKVFEESMKNDLEWFQHFDEDLQEEIFLALLCMGGGGLLKSFSKAIMQSNPKTTPIQPRGSIHEMCELKRSGEFNVSAIVGFAKTYSEPLDPYNQVDLIVINKRKEWSNMMAKYRVAVKGKEKAAGKQKKSEKESSKKSSKTTKSTKTTKSGKGGTKSGAAEIDYIQLLPIQIVKKIFGYLDKKFLKKAKTINPYWEYVVTSMAQDAKARKMLNKAIVKLEKTVPENYEPLERLCKPQRDAVCLNKSAASKKIQRKLKLQEAMKEESLITKAVKDMAESYLIPIDDNLKSFPRQSKVDKNYHLYKGLPYIIYEGGILEKGISKLEPISEDYNIPKKMSKIQVFSPTISSEDLSENAFAPAKVD